MFFVYLMKGFSFILIMNVDKDDIFLDKSLIILFK